MPVLNVAWVASDDRARTVGKKGDSRDIDSYVYKQVVGDEVRVISLLRPLRHPERLRPLLSVLNVAKVGVVEISKVDAALGEVLVAFGCAGIDNGHAIIAAEEGGWVDPEQVKVILQQAGLSGWTLHENWPDEHELRNILFAHMDDGASEREQEQGAALVIPVDQHFNVKGVGLVAIGYVQSGTVNKHDEVSVLPTSENGIARSLQVMDDDVEVATAGDRVGVALRNLREEALHRGCILVSANSDAMQRHDSSKISLRIAPFQQRKLTVGDVIHAAVDLQFTVGRVSEVEGDDIAVDWEHPLLIRSDGSQNVLLVQLDAGSMRIMGVAQSIATG